jgi:hypothetical protein
VKNKHKTVADYLRERGYGGPAGNGTPEPPEEDYRCEPEVRPPEWPEPPGEDAYVGTVGEFVRVVGPHTEADPVALAIQLLVGFGNIIGREAFFVAEDDFHYLNEFAVLVGRTSKGRKGTSWGRARRQLESADEEWVRDRIASGLSTGEGLIHLVRDATTARDRDGNDVEDDPGVKDKRLLCYEPEFASVLKRADQQGNTLTAVLRMAFDSGDLRTLTRHSPLKATGAHVSLIAHCTTEELTRYLSATESANGFGNRILWLCVRRSKCLPEGGCLDPHELDGVRDRLRQAVELARGAGRMRRDEPARLAWHAVYEQLSEGRPGMAGALLGRAEVHVMRLACLYALLGLSRVVRLQDLKAALSLWEFCERSVRFVFGNALGDPVADELLQLLVGAGAHGVSRTEIRDFFGRNRGADRISRALGLLLAHKLARAESRQEKGTGRPVERWYATNPGRG